MQIVAIGIQGIGITRTKCARVQARLTVGRRQCGILTQRRTLLSPYYATGKGKNGQKNGQDSSHFFKAANDYVKRSCKKAKGNACLAIYEQNQVISTYFCPAMFEVITQKLSEKNARLVAVSKTHPPESIMPLYLKGQRIFGENRVQELQQKYEVLPKDIQWHLIGHLQSNKVKYIAPYVSLIHSVDSLELLKEINKQAARNNRMIDCLLQFHIATEETKFGLSEQEGTDLLNNPAFGEFKNIRICGVMGMATFTDDQTLVRSEFRHLKSIFESLKARFFENTPWFCEISMGMSGDWEIALEEGSTLVRIGSLLFGQRN
jgi:pyridoxal phosphate enzyme (YggS family)